MKILITGGNGFLGQHLCRHLKDTYKVYATGRGERRIPFETVGYSVADITDADCVETLMQQVRPDVVIHTAAMSKPDECDVHRAACNQINVMATGYLLHSSKQLEKAPQFIYVSTDFVLGDDGPHDENAIPAPLNYYGESKLTAERLVAASELPYTIVRPVFMYGEIWEGMRSTFLHWIKQNLEEGKPIKLVNDQHRTPTYVGDICKGINSIIDLKAAGLFHLAGAERITPYAMGLGLAEYLCLDATLIEPVTDDSFKEPVRRAKQAGVVIEKARKELGFEPIGYEEGLRLSFKV